MYYKARDRALNNGQTYHLAAILRRKGKVVKVGTNTDKTHPKFKREYPDGTYSAHMHAEMNVLRFAQPGDTLEVMRFLKCAHEFAMAKPCRHCTELIRDAGISSVRYTNYQGEWEELSV